MKALDMFSIPIKGLNIGRHQYEFSINKEFFAQFEDSQIKEGQFVVEVELIKQSNMMELWFEITGEFNTICDRCLVPIDLPTTGKYRLVVKKDEDDTSDNEEVIYIDENTPSVNLAEHIYEFIHLSRPLRNIKNCEAEGYISCDKVVLKKLDINFEPQENKNQLWDQLKNIDLGKI